MSYCLEVEHFDRGFHETKNRKKCEDEGFIFHAPYLSTIQKSLNCPERDERLDFIQCHAYFALKNIHCQK